MDKSSWKVYAEVVGITAIVASLIFVGLQMRQDRVIAVATAQASFLETFVQINSEINEHAAIWDSGLVGGELSGADEVIFRNLAANVRRYSVIQSLEFRSLGLIGDFPIVQLADLVRRNPGLAREVAEESERVDHAFTVASTGLPAGSLQLRIEAAIERLDRIDPLVDSF